jgi:hypothetical protein
MVSYGSISGMGSSLDVGVRDLMFSLCYEKQGDELTWRTFSLENKFHFLPTLASIKW